ncbi:hypothetical protein BD289DRAFT_250550 [Coniella lustricola]|uniref:Uncharacterized protein n=1 Tax=Coniella lustricola TaxID=2025994 RepID=A0A2T3A8K6_9PEZI|nr:hypothetical protein BD289DRAFT_250550 [Coniella lustricola]
MPCVEGRYLGKAGSSWWCGRVMLLLAACLLVSTCFGRSLLWFACWRRRFGKQGFKCASAGALVGWLAGQAPATKEFCERANPEWCANGCQSWPRDRCFLEGGGVAEPDGRRRRRRLVGGRRLLRDDGRRGCDVISSWGQVRGRESNGNKQTVQQQRGAARSSAQIATVIVLVLRMACKD